MSFVKGDWTHAPMCRRLAAWCCTRGSVAEMQTGEGKTLVATLPAYLNALDRASGVHVVTVNDYLAKRDADWCAASTTRYMQDCHPPV